MGCCDMRGGLVEEFTADCFYVDGTADRLFSCRPRCPLRSRARPRHLLARPGAGRERVRGPAAAGRGAGLSPRSTRHPARADPRPDAYRARFRGWLPRCPCSSSPRRTPAGWGGRDAASRNGWPPGPRPSFSPRAGTADGSDAERRRDSVPGSGSPSWTPSAPGDTVNAALLHRLEARDALPGGPHGLGTDAGSMLASPPARRPSPARGRARSRRTPPNWAFSRGRWRCVVGGAGGGGQQRDNGRRPAGSSRGAPHFSCRSRQALRARVVFFAGVAFVVDPAAFLVAVLFAVAVLAVAVFRAVALAATVFSAAVLRGPFTGPRR